MLTVTHTFATRMSNSYTLYTSFAEFLRDPRVVSLREKPICRGIDVIEKANTANLKHYYVIIENQGQAQAFAYFQLLQVKPFHFNLQGKRWQQLSLHLVLQWIRPTMLVAGNLFRHDVSFFQFLDDDIDDATKGKIYLDTINHLIAHTKASGLFIKDVPRNLGEFIQQDDSYQRMPDDISMEMHLPAPWQSIADYEKALKHKYLQRYKKMRQSFSEIEVRELSHNDILRYSKEMEALYMQVTRKQMVSMGILNHQFFEFLKTVLQDDYKVCGYFIDQKMVAFSSAIVHDAEYDMNYIGFDYAVNQSHHLYFNILFQCLDNAIQSKCRKLILGRTALEAKAILGCEADYRYSFYKLRNGILNRFYQKVSANFRERQGDKWKERHPFKSSYYELSA
jgi:hypothetical protein